MAATECLTPSPPISSSPGSLSSATSNTDSAPNPASPPPPSSNYFDHHPSPFPSSSKLREPIQNASMRDKEAKRRNRLSTPLILEGSAVDFGHSTTQEGGSSGGSGGSGSRDGRRRRPSIRTRTLSLSFSPREQAFTPTTMQPSQSTVDAASFPFPSPPLALGASTIGDGVSRVAKSDERSSPTNSTSSARMPLDRSPSNASTATTTRRPRPVRSSMSRIDPPSRSTSLRPPTSVPMSNRPSTSSAEGEATQQLEAKVVILGSQGVGKTSIIARCTTGQFRNSLSSTVGASLLTKKITIDATQVRFQIWDPAGQERFRSMAPLYYRGALAAILVYDVTDESSFEDIKIWLEELRKNMTDELIILVVGAKADLSNSFRTIPLDSAQRQVAIWLNELDNPPESKPSTIYTPSLASGLNTPFPAVDSTILEHQPSPRGSSPSSPSRSRTGTLPSSSHPPLSKPQLGAIAPSRPSTPSAALDRVRKMSNQLSSRESSSSSSSSGGRSHLKHPGLTTSMTMPDLGAFTTSSTSSSTIMPPPHSPSFQTLPQTSNLNPHESGVVRSTSTKIGLSLSSLGMSAARRLSHDDRMKKTWEDAVFERERERRDREEAEEKRISKLVRECPVRVVEVSAKDGFGIEEVFYSIAEQLIVRKAEIERARVLRSRNSIMLHETPPIDTSKSGWCAC
ncbi:hypothetical protein JCM5350_003001 [Sporobolomyces pararoseus]